MNKETLKNFLKADAFEELKQIETDQDKELPQPAVQKSCPASPKLIDLVSAGARHSFETYLAVLNIEGLEKGIYRYLPLEHKLLFLYSDNNLADKLNSAVLNQKFVSNSAVTFIWATIPYRMEWRYSVASAKLIAIDAGHVCENIYLAAESINAGTCAIAAYDQDQMDRLIDVDGNNEFTIYLAAVGKVK